MKGGSFNYKPHAAATCRGDKGVRGPRRARARTHALAAVSTITGNYVNYLSRHDTAKRGEDLGRACVTRLGLLHTPYPVTHSLCRSTPQAGGWLGHDLSLQARAAQGHYVVTSPCLLVSCVPGPESYLVIAVAIDIPIYLSTIMTVPGAHSNMSVGSSQNELISSLIEHHKDKGKRPVMGRNSKFSNSM
ncbi:hypothetical protein J6590_013954 [Homalodisca vitripennis]|nr:hypothetical protein J6590_013954 [Homalodisca vitripennis]